MCTSGTPSGRGAALVIVMLVMAVLLLAGTTFLTIASTESQIAQNEWAGIQAFFLAESALQRAIALLNTYPLGSIPASGDSGTISVASGQQLRFTFTDSGAQGCPDTVRTVVATGNVSVRGGQAASEVRATVDRVTYPFRWAAFSTIPNGIVSGARIDKELWLQAGSTTDSYDSRNGSYDPTPSGSPVNRTAFGSIGANGDVWLDGGTPTVISGSIRAGDAVNRTVSSTVTGAITADASPATTFSGVSAPASGTCPFPTVSGEYYISGGTYLCSTIAIPGNTTIRFTGPVTVYVTGNVSVGNGVTMGRQTTEGQSPTQLTPDVRLVLKSDASDTTFVSFTAGTNFAFYGGIYGRNADIATGSGANVYGSVVARTIAPGTNSNLHYDQALQDREVCNADKYAVRRGTWREVIP